MEVPAGTYRLVGYQVQRKDDGGNLWHLRGTGARNGPELDLPAGGSLTLSYGEPFTVKITATRLGRKNTPLTQARLTCRVTGAGGERITDLRSTTYNPSAVARSKSSRHRPLEPKYMVRTGDGKIVAVGSFRYG